MKPNVMRKTFASEILGMNFRLWITMKARRCIMKAGSFDNYLLNTKPALIDSRMGLHLRMLLKQK
jgi:large subunit ribosomal protein L28